MRAQDSVLWSVLNSRPFIFVLSLTSFNFYLIYFLFFFKIYFYLH